MISAANIKTSVLEQALKKIWMIFCLLGSGATAGELRTDANANSSETAASVQIVAADGKPPYGTFDVIAPDGQVYREIIRADGTFTSRSADGYSVEGVWEQRLKGIFCSKPLGAPVFRCKHEVINENGEWTSTELDGGEVSIVERIE